MKNRRFLIISGIIGLGFLLRCLYIEKRGIWYDDAFSIFLSEQDLSAIVSGTAADTMPPLYYFLLHLWIKLFGERTAILRFLNIIISEGIIILMYYWGKQLLGEKAGLWMAFLTAVSPINIYHAQELRMYVLLSLSQLGYIFFFTRLLMNKKLASTQLLLGNSFSDKKAELINWGGLTICGIAALYSHNLAVFVLCVPNFYLLVKRDYRLFWKMVICQLIIGIFFIPWLLMVPGQVDKIQQAFWTPRPGLVEIIQALVMFTATLPLPGIWQMIAVLLSIEIPSLLILGLRKLLNNRDEAIILILLILIPPTLLFALSYIMRPIFVPRGFIFSSLAYYALAGLVITKVTPKWLGRAALGGFIVASIISLPYFYIYSKFPRSPFKETTQYLQTVFQPGDKVIHDNKLSAFPSIYYARELPQTFIGDERGSHNDTLALNTQKSMDIFPEANIEQAVLESHRVYFVVFTQAISEYQQMGETGHPQISWLKEHFTLVNRRIFNDLEVYQFER